MEQRIKSPTLSAGVSVAVIVLVLLVPAGFVTQNLLSQAAYYAKKVQRGIASGQFEQELKNNRYLGPLVTRLTKLTQPAESAPASDGKPADNSGSEQKPPEKPPENNGNSPRQEAPRPEGTFSEIVAELEASETPPQPTTRWSPFDWPSGSSLASAAGSFTSQLGSLVSGAVWIGMQLMITVMCLFFFLRDRHSVVRGIRLLMPLSESEADKILQRVNDTIHATIFGSLSVAFVQGCMGGFMFWMLGLPSPLFWGATMGLLAVVPLLGPL